MGFFWPRCSLNPYRLRRFWFNCHKVCFLKFTLGDTERLAEKDHPYFKWPAESLLLQHIREKVFMPGVFFANIFRTAFSYKCYSKLLRAFSFCLYFFGKWKLLKKAVRKMLLKLTTGRNRAVLRTAWTDGEAGAFQLWASDACWRWGWRWGWRRDERVGSDRWKLCLLVDNLYAATVATLHS